MKIFIKNLSGYLVSLEVLSSDTIYIVKQQIRRREGVPVFRQHLLLGGTTLEDCRTLSECNIVTHSTIDLKFRHYLVPSSTEQEEVGAEMDPRVVDLAYSVVVGKSQLWKANYHRKYQQWPLMNGIIAENTLESIVIQCDTDVIVEKMGLSERLIVQLYKIKTLPASHVEEELIDGSLFIDTYNYLIRFTPSSTSTTSSSTYKLVMNVAGYDSSSLMFETTGNVNDVSVDISRSFIASDSCSEQHQHENMEAIGNNVDDNDLVNTVYDAEEANIDRLCGEIKTQLLPGDCTTSGEEMVRMRMTMMLKYQMGNAFKEVNTHRVMDINKGQYVDVVHKHVATKVMRNQSRVEVPLFLYLQQ